MKKHLRRFLSMLLAMCIIQCTFYTTSAAASESATVSSAITSFVKKYTENFKNSYDGRASQCCAFVNYIWNGVFGTDIYGKHGQTIHGKKKTSNVYKFLSDNNAKAGEILWCHNKPAGQSGNTITHYMVILSYDKSGVTISDGMQSGKGLKWWHNGKKVSYSDPGFAKKRYFDGSCYLSLYKLNDSYWNPVAKNKLSSDVKFSIGKSDYPTGNKKKGFSYSLKGTIQSNKVIASFKGEVIGENGKAALTASEIPCKRKISISNSSINKQLKFSSLAAGTYYLKYTVKDGSGTSKTWKSPTFKVTGTGSTSTSTNTPNKPSSKTFTISFNANGGKVSKSSTKVTSGKTYGTLPTPTRNGYTFNGWYTSANGGTKITSSSKVNLNGNQTLYAHWTAITKKYTVTFDANGGQVSQKTKKVAEGSTIGTMPVPTRSGYTFQGWFINRSGSGNALISSNNYYIMEDTTLYAQWKKNSVELEPEQFKTVTVTFDVNIDDGTSVYPSTKEVTVGEPYGTLPEVVSSYGDALIFTGWFTQKGSGSQVTEGTTVSSKSDHTLYAHWDVKEEPRCDVYFDPNGGSLYSTTKPIYMISVTVGHEYGDLPTPTRDGYTFTGWYTSANGGTQITSEDISSYEGKQTLYAHWTEMSDNIYSDSSSLRINSFDAYFGEANPHSAGRQIYVSFSIDSDQYLTRGVINFNGDAYHWYDPDDPSDGSKNLSCHQTTSFYVEVEPGGTYTLTITAYDVSGNSVSKTITCSS